MKTRILFLLLAVTIILPSSSFGQFGGVVRRAVNRQISNELDSALDKKVQDEQNKNRAAKAEQEKAQQNAANEAGNATDSSGDNSGGAAFTGLFGNKITLKYNDDYSFTSRIHMVSEQYDGKESLKMNFYMYYSATHPSVAVETQKLSDGEDEVGLNANMVMDAENKILLMLTEVDGTKIGTITEVPDENTTIVGPDGKPVKKYTPPTFTKTGNTRVIAGFKCDEYSYKNPEDKTSGKIWFTKDANVKIDKRGWNNSGMSYYYGSRQFDDGIILASEAYDNKGRLQAKSETIEINERFPHKISVNGYTLRQMNIPQKK